MTATARQAAQAAGLTTYFTGKPCKRGHVSARHTKDRQCVVCRIEVSQARPVKFRKLLLASKAKEKGDKYYTTGRPCIRGHMCERTLKGACVQCRRDDSRKRRRALRATEAGRVRMNKISCEWMRRKKGMPEPTRPCPSHCECCGRKFGRKAAALEHCHKTNVFRGWLCDQCNTALGLAGDSIEVLYCLIAYLQRNGA